MSDDFDTILTRFGIYYHFNFFILENLKLQTPKSVRFISLKWILSQKLSDFEYIHFETKFDRLRTSLVGG